MRPTSTTGELSAIYLAHAWIRKRRKSIPPDNRPRYSLVSDSDHCVKLFATRSVKPVAMTYPSPRRRHTLRRILPLPETTRRRTSSPPEAGRLVAWSSSSEDPALSPHSPFRGPWDCTFPDYTAVNRGQHLPFAPLADLRSAPVLLDWTLGFPHLTLVNPYHGVFCFDVLLCAFAVVLLSLLPLSTTITGTWWVIKNFRPNTFTRFPLLGHGTCHLVHRGWFLT